MKKFFAIALVLCVLASAHAQSTPIPSAVTAKQKLDEFKKLKAEMEDLESKRADLEKALQDAKKKVDDATVRANKAEQESTTARDAFQKEIQSIKDALDASLKLLDSEAKPVYPSPKIEPKTIQKSDAKSGFKDSFTMPETTAVTKKDVVLTNADDVIVPFPETPKAGRLVVKIDPTAKLWINDRLTDEGGNTRQFQTPEIVDADKYHYRLKVEYADRTVVTRDVIMKAGHKTTTTFK